MQMTKAGVIGLGVIFREVVGVEKAALTSNETGSLGLKSVQMNALF